MWDQAVDLALKPSLSCSSLDNCQTVIYIHSPVEVMLLPQMISLISFFCWLTAALPRFAFLRLRIHTSLTPVYVLIHTLHIYCTLYTHHTTYTPGSICLLCYSQSLFVMSPFLFTPLFIHTYLLPQNQIFSSRMGNRRLRSWSIVTM